MGLYSAACRPSLLLTCDGLIAGAVFFTPSFYLTALSIWATDKMGRVPFLKVELPGSIYECSLLAMPLIATIFSFMVRRSISALDGLLAVRTLWFCAG